MPLCRKRHLCSAAGRDDCVKNASQGAMLYER